MTPAAQGTTERELIEACEFLTPVIEQLEQTAAALADVQKVELESAVRGALEDIRLAKSRAMKALRDTGIGPDETPHR